MGEFDDLIPAKRAAQPAASGAFDDLIPAPLSQNAAAVSLGDWGEGYNDFPMPERTWAQAGLDAATKIRMGVNSVTGGAVGLPVNLANLAMTPARTGAAWAEGLGATVPDAIKPWLAPIQQPDAVLGIRESLGIANAEEHASLSRKAQRQAADFEEVDGFWPSLKYLAQNPSFTGLELAAQIPQFALQMTPGSALGTMATQALGAAGQNTQQVEEEIASRGGSREDATEAGVRAFAPTLALGALPTLIPGGMAFEKLMTGQLGRGTAKDMAGRIALGLKSLLGETATEAAQEGGEQAIQNYAVGDPLDKGVGKASALGAALGAAMGGPAGITQAVTATPDGQPRQAPAAPPAGPAPAGDNKDPGFRIDPATGALEIDIVDDGTRTPPPPTGLDAIDELLIRGLGDTDPADVAPGTTTAPSTAPSQGGEPIAAQPAPAQTNLGSTPAVPPTETAQAVVTPAGQPAPAPAGGDLSDEAPSNHQTEGAVVELPLDALTLSDDVPQFKSGADGEGVVEPLGGTFDRRGTGPIQVWRRKDGRMEIISGRHRTDLARRSGEKSIPAQVYDEANGFDARQAASLDAELNIRDGQGKVKDYVQFFQQPAFQGAEGQQTADARGLLARATGKRAYAIASKGVPDLVAAHSADRLTDEAAYQIAEAAPGNARLQALGMRLVQDGKPIGVAANTMRAVSTMSGGDPGGGSLDMFGFDDSAVQDAIKMAGVALRQQRELAERLAAITGASKRPELAAKEGVDVRNPKAMDARIRELRAEKIAWDEWSTNPDLVAKIRAELGLEPQTQAEPEPEAAPEVDPAQQGFAIAEDGPGLFGAPSTADRVGAARRDRDARRDGRAGTGPTDMRSGDGELFAGQRPEQADLAHGELPAQDRATYGETRPLFAGSERGRVESPGEASPGRRAAPAIRAQLDLFVATRNGKPPGQGHEPVTKINRAQLLQTTKLVQTGQFRSGVERVDSLADAAHILAPLRKSPQEQFLALVIDAEGKPLAVLRHSIGLINQTDVSPGTIFGAVASIPGAQRVVFGHNHPSGSTQASAGDLKVEYLLADLFRGSGIEVMGSVIVQPGRKRFTSYTYAEPFGQGEITPARRRGAVPRVERTLNKVQPIEGRKKISGPESARRVALEYAEDSPAGALLLNYANEVVGVLPFDPAQATRLRTGDKATSHASLVAPAIEANAAGVILYGSTAHKAGLQNAGRAFRDSGLTVRDALILDAMPNTAGSIDYLINGPLESVESAEPFYSALAAAIDTGKGAPKKADAAAWKGWLDGAQRRGEIKQSERDWLGVDAWLDAQGDKISREALAEFVRAHELQVKDVMLGGPVQVSDALNVWMGDQDMDEPTSKEDWLAVVQRLGEEGATRRFEGDLAAADALFDLMNEAHRIAGRTSFQLGAPKFASYQLPGGENYREFALVLPNPNEVRSTEAEAINARLGEMVDQHGAVASMPTDVQAEFRRLEADYYRLVDAPESPVFRVPYSHSMGNGADVNRIAHVRFNERTDADGKRVLFIEEIQSDWHQAGRKEGYGGHRLVEETHNGKTYYKVVDASGKAQTFAGSGVSLFGEKAAAESAMRDLSGVPDAPFKATDEWAMLAFKRMVRHAAENGFDRIAWTTGEQQAARYDLSKQVELLMYRKNDDGTYAVKYDAVGRGGTHTLSERLSESGLEDNVGKEIAKKIADGEGRPAGGGVWFALSGGDLKVGGEGMVGFYDKILPKAVNKWGKKFGARVGAAKINSTETLGDIGDGSLAVVRPNGEVIALTNYDSQAYEIARENPGARVVAASEVDPRGGAAVHSLDLTPAMRDAALAGMPLFQQEAGQVAPEALSDSERSAFDRQSIKRGSLRAAVSRHKGDRDVDANGVREAVAAVTGQANAPIHYVRGMDGLETLATPDYVAMLQRHYAGRNKGLRTAGLYVPAQWSLSGKPFAVVVTDVATTPEVAAFTAAHELAGHHGLRTLLGDKLNPALELALQNPTVAAIADSMTRTRKLAPGKRLLAAEEALADLAAAARTGDWARVEAKHGVKVSATMRSRVLTAIANFLRRLKALLTKQGVTFTDAQVRSLLENAWSAAQGNAATASALAADGTLEQVVLKPAADGAPDLVATHNLTARKLMHAIRMGGLPVPSLAVTKGDNALTSFGEITLIGSKSLVDPARGAKTFGADIYSPRYPTLNYKLNAAALDKLNAALPMLEGDRPFYGAEINRLEDLTQTKRFKAHAAATLGENASWRDMEAEAQKILSDVGAEERMFQGFTNSGNRRYKAHTLENVVAILKKGLRGGESFNYGVGSLRAKFTPQFRTLAQIRNEKGRLVSEADFKRVKDEVDAEFFAIVDMLRPETSNELGFSDRVIGVMEDAAKMGVRRALTEYDMDATDETRAAISEFMDKLRTLPAEYFESKQLRSVDIHEFSAAVVPSDVAADVRAALAKRGISVTEYPPGDDVARRAAIHEAAQDGELLFQEESTDDSDLILESVPFTPEEEALMAKVGTSADMRSSVRRALDWVRDLKPDQTSDDYIASTLDSFHGIKRAVAETGGIPMDRDPYIAARLLNTASTMEAVLLYGAPKLDNGVLRLDRSIPGLMEALRPVVSEMPRFLTWMVARRAKVLKAQGRENLMDDQEIATGLAMRVGREAEFDQAANDYLRLKDAILNVGEDAGLIDPVARAMWDSAEYIPFYREREAGAAGPGTRQGIANQSDGIRRLKGGVDHINDPLANIIQNFTRIMDASMKNRALLLAVDELGAPFFRKAAMEVKAEVIPLDQVRKHLLGSGMTQQAVAALPQAALKGVAKMLAIKAPTGEDVVRVMRAGKAEYYHVDDPLLLRALTAFNQAPTHPLVKPFVWAKQLLTAGATMTMDFAAANTLRDTAEAFATSQDRFIPVVDTLRGAIQRIRESELTQDLMMAGSAFHSGLFHTGRTEDTAKAIRRALRKSGMSQGAVTKHVNTLVSPARWWDGYRTLLEASEMGSRILLAQRRMEAGGTFQEGAFEAKDFLDFTMRGDDRFVQFFISVLPFLNARLQGGYRLARVGTTKGRRGRLAARMSGMALATTALYWWNMLLYADGYDELEDWDKDAYWHIAPGTDRHTRIPKPFEIGLVVGTGVERMYEAMRYQLTEGESGDRPSKTWDALMRGIMETMAINPIPQLARGPAELQANRNFHFDSPIESLGDDKKAPEDRFGPRTSRPARYASRAMTALVGDEHAVSPKKLDHLWRSYTAGMGGYLLDSADWVVRKAEGAPPEPEMALRDYPLVGRFMRGDTPGSTRYVDEFYTLRERALMQSTRVKEAVIDGNAAKAARVEAEHGWLLGERIASKQAKGGFMHAGVRALTKVADRMGDLRKADQAIYDSRTMGRKEKREALDANTRERNALVKKMVRQLNEAERRQRAQR